MRLTRFATPLALTMLVLLTAGVAAALNPGTDLLVPAAARAGTWVTDLYVLNPGSQSTTVTVYWLERNQANPSPTSESFTIDAGETLVLDDVILTTFSMTTGEGAFRIVSDTEAVVANCRIYNDRDGVTFGQGLAATPRGGATAAGSETDVVGLSQSDSFRSNIFLVDASGAGSQASLSLRDTSGNELLSHDVTLRAFEPTYLNTETHLGADDFADATLHVEVTSGSVLVVGSKVDNDPATGDPTTLEAWQPAGGGSTEDGTYQFALYDSALFAAGGNIVVDDGEVVAVNGTYFNWDKTDGGEPECTLLFLWGGAIDPPIPVADFATGISFDQSYPTSGQMTWTLQLTMSDNMALSGTVGATGSDFPAGQDGCDGVFPDLVLYGGKTE